MPKMLPPVCFCEYCNEKYFEFPKDGMRLLNQWPGLMARKEHYRVCDKVPFNVRGRVIGGKKSKTGEGNCPCCGLIMRADKIVQHCAAKHAWQLVAATEKHDIELAKKYQLPVLRGQAMVGKELIDVVTCCLACKKGCIRTAPDHFQVGGVLAMKHDHKDCIKRWPEFSEIFDYDEAQVELPFDVHTSNERKRKHVAAVIVPGDIITEPPVVIVPGDIKPLGGAGTALDADELEELELLRKRNEILEKERDELRQRLQAKQTAAVKDNMKELMKALSFAMTMEEDTMEEIDDMIEYVKGIDETINSAVKDAKKPLYRKIADLEKKVADYESGREVARLKDRVKELMEDRRQTAVFEGTMVKLGYRGKPIDSDSD